MHEEIYQDWRGRRESNPSAQPKRLNAGEFRVMIAKCVSKAWKEILANQANAIRRSFESMGLSLSLDGSEDATKLHFQGQARGIPPGLSIPARS